MNLILTSFAAFPDHHQRKNPSGKEGLLAKSVIKTLLIS